MTEYKLLKKIVINGKKRNIYKKKGSRKQYIKCKGKMMNLVKYKKMKSKKLPKKRKTKKKGGDYVTTQFEKLPGLTRAYILLRGYRDFQEREKGGLRRYNWKDRVEHNEALIPFSKKHVELINQYKDSGRKDVENYDILDMKRDINRADRDRPNGEILIKINLTDMPDYELKKTDQKVRRDTLPATHTPTQVQQVQQYSSNPRVRYQITTYQGIPFKKNIEGEYKKFEECTGANPGHNVPFCKVEDRYYPGQECDNVPNRCKLKEHATNAHSAFKKYNAESVTVEGQNTRDVAHAAAKKLYSNGGKKKRVKRKKTLVKK